MRQILPLIIFLVIIFSTLSSFSQISKRDFVFDWKNKKDNSWIFIDSTFQKFTPSIDEIRKAKEISIKYIDSLERIRIQKNKFRKILKYDHKEYYRQYVGFIDKTGNRIVFINACCSEFGQKNDLNKDWIFVFDGGSCFFQIKIDLRTEKCFDFSVNGEA